MAILVREDIEARIARGNIVFTPALDTFQLQAHTVDLRLGFTFLVPRLWQVTERGRVALVFDPLDGGHAHFDPVELEPGQYFELLPGERVLVSTLERITMPNDVSAVLYPRSTVNRQGLAVELTGIIDAGYQGNLVIPIHNSSTSSVVRIYPGQRFCQLEFNTLAQEITPRLSRYQNKDVIVGVLPEQDTVEVELIRQGRIEELKRRHGITLGPSAGKPES
ncbi:MAG: dCTP deaminase [Ktedonobacterales bacterium]